MMNMKKFGIISAAIIGLYSSPSIIANNLPNDLDLRSFYHVSSGIVHSDGRLEHLSYVDPVFQNHCLAQNQASIDQDATIAELNMLKIQLFQDFNTQVKNCGMLLPMRHRRLLLGT